MHKFLRSLQIKTNSGDWLMRSLVNAYLFLIIYDGVFRKWIFPSYSNIIMVLKVAVACLIVFRGAKYLSKATWWEKSFAIVGVIVFLLTLLVGHQNLLVDIWGCIPYWFGLTVCFVLGRILTKPDLMTIGRYTVYAGIIHSILVTIQHFLPVNHFLNSGDDAKERFANYYAYQLGGGFRPSGIFMSNTAGSLFLLCAFSFALYFMLVNRTVMNRRMVVVAVILMVASTVFAVSRTEVFLILGMTAFVFITCLQGRARKNFIRSLVVMIPLVAVLWFTPTFQRALDNMGDRFDSASRSVSKQESTFMGNLEDIYNRNVVYVVKALVDPHTLGGEVPPFFGYGQGMSTQVGGRLLNVKTYAGFALAEWVGLRYVGESGIMVGWRILFIRIGYASASPLAYPPGRDVAPTYR